MTYKNVIVGGTFDRFHKGHKALLDRAFAAGEKVYLGITSDEYVAKIKNYQARYAEVKEYLKTRGWLGRVETVPIHDRFGTTLVDQTLEAIVVSPETELVATEINLLRAQKSWSALEVIVVPWVMADDGQPIHAVRIRRGEIDREGGSFTLASDWGIRKLPEGLREKLKRPLGRLVSSLQRAAGSGQSVKRSQLSTAYYKLPANTLLITVGDAVTSRLLQQNVIPDIAVVDLYIGRKRVYKDLSELGFVAIKNHFVEKNPAGTLSFSVYQTLRKMIQSVTGGVLEIQGEEDLITLFAIFISPLGSLVMYGQPGVGVVEVEVTEEKKKEIRGYLKQFKLT